MNKIKVNEFVSAYSNAVDLNKETKEVLLELMENIILKYEKTIPYIPVNEDDSTVYLIKPINGKYSVEDFFLNRLMRNIWTFEEITQKLIDQGYKPKRAKGTFDPGLHEVYVNSVKLEKQLEKYQKYLGENYQKIKERAKKKVIMHEFEHGLQTTYNNKLDIRYREQYKKISNEINKIGNGKYRNILRTYEEIPKELSDTEEYIKTGTHYSSKATMIKGKTYRDVDGFDNLNEILNESESLEMCKQENYLTYKFNNTGTIYKVANPESSNYSITNYGYLFKMLLGINNSFKLMYLNSPEMFESFNQKYNQIFQQVYQSDKDAIEIFITSITKIKNDVSEEEHLRLNYALSKCLELKVTKFYNDKNTTNETMLSTINKFEKLTLKNPNNNLEHTKVLNNLKNIINQRNINQTDNFDNYQNLNKKSR